MNDWALLPLYANFSLRCTSYFLMGYVKYVMQFSQYLTIFLDVSGRRAKIQLCRFPKMHCALQSNTFSVRLLLS